MPREAWLENQNAYAYAHRTSCRLLRRLHFECFCPVVYHNAHYRCPRCCTWRGSDSPRAGVHLSPPTDPTDPVLYARPVPVAPIPYVRPGALVPAGAHVEPYDDGAGYDRGP